MSINAIAMKNLYFADKITYHQLQSAYERNLITYSEFELIVSLKSE